MRYFPVIFHVSGIQKDLKIFTSQGLISVFSEYYFLPLPGYVGLPFNIDLAFQLYSLKAKMSI